MIAWIVALALSACAPQGPEIRVVAASSLTDALTDVAEVFAQDHEPPRLAFAGSQTLRLQIEAGAPAHAFLSARTDHLDALVEEGLLDSWSPVARGRVVLATPAHNPAHLTRLADLPHAERIVLGTEAVPIGRYARSVLDRAAADLGEDFARTVMHRVVSEEANVRLIRAKVALGEADAAFLYASDVVGAPDLHVIDLPDALQPDVQYGAGALDPRAEPFLAFLASDEARDVLERHGLHEP